MEATKLHNEAERAGARNGRERSNNQNIQQKPGGDRPRRGPGPAEVVGALERGQWPKLVDTRQRLRALRGGGTREREWNIYEFPRGTEKGQFQLWIDGNYAKNVTAEMIAARGGLLAFDSRDLMEEIEDGEELED